MKTALEAAFQDAIDARAAELRGDIDRQQAIANEREIQHSNHVTEATKAFEAAFALDNNTQED